MTYGFWFRQLGGLAGISFLLGVAHALELVAARG
jgi:hypothetical protein